ncbi:hypothetical protein LTR86_008159 [Recurvomyces mirabilis]|nr:hypothetical protein LTR86_008159 [Recurvomyces mirabilis]
MATLEHFCQSLDSSMVTVEVGSGADSKRFTAPKALLCDIPWFENALKDERFKEGIEARIMLPDDPPRIVPALCYYAYRCYLNFPSHLDWSREEFVDELSLCIDLWLFGDKYDIKNIQDIVMYHICVLLRKLDAEYAGWSMPDDVLVRCFLHTMPSSPLRKVAADIIVRQIHGGRNTAPTATKSLDTLGACDGFTTELLSSQHLYYQGTEAGFPRYLRPVRFASALRVDKDSESVPDASDWAYFKFPEWSGNECQECNLCGVAAASCLDCEGTDILHICDTCRNGVW